MVRRGREGGRKGGREGGRKGGREGGREVGREKLDDDEVIILYYLIR